MGTLRRTWSRRWLARRMTPKGSATPGACASTRLYAFRYEPDMTRHRPADSLTPFGGLRPEPGCGAFCRSTTDYVEPGGGLPRRRQRCTRPWYATCLSAPTTLLVDAHSSDLAYPVGVGFQQGFAPAADLVVHRMPPTTKFCGDLVDRATPPTDPDGHPPRRSGCQQRPLGTNRGVLLDERPERTVGIRTCPTAFPPPQPNRTAERRQIHQHHRSVTLGPHRATTGLTGRPGLARTDHHLQAVHPRPSR